MLVTQQPVLRRFWYTTMPVGHLQDGPRPFTLLNEKIVLFLDAEGRPAALADRCCHRTARLSKACTADGLLVCGYHGWAYNRTGQCVRIPQADAQAIPAGARVPAYRCEAHHGYAWVALEDPLLPLPDIPEAHDPQFRRIDQFYEVWKCASLRFMENAFDNAHFSFVHKHTFGQVDQPTPSQYALWPTTWGFDSETIVPVNNPPHAVRITGDPHPVTTRHLRNKWFLPFTRVFHATYLSGRQHIIMNCATPIDDNTTQLCQ
jgi:phenylpropionate dioxygenase-like ring-hydroxylating dioxygenase large terminal subunit